MASFWGPTRCAISDQSKGGYLLSSGMETSPNGADLGVIEFESAVRP